MCIHATRILNLDRWMEIKNLWLVRPFVIDVIRNLVYKPTTPMRHSVSYAYPMWTSMGGYLVLFLIALCHAGPPSDRRVLTTSF